MQIQNTNAAQEADVIAIDQLRELNGRIRAELGKIIVGQHTVIEQLLTCIFARGHALLMGVPGLAKTLLVHSLADLMSLNFSRVQFTPDLMPSDITGTEILQETDQAMQEQKVNAGKHSFTLEKPFFVLATQNPIEQEGTYPLPEAQLDRFMFLINVGYPTAAEELQIAKTTTGGAMPVLDKILHAEDILRFQDVVRRVPVPDHVYDHIVKLVR